MCKIHTLKHAVKIIKVALNICVIEAAIIVRAILEQRDSDKSKMVGMIIKTGFNFPFATCPCPSCVSSPIKLETKFLLFMPGVPTKLPRLTMLPILDLLLSRIRSKCAELLGV